ncbi:uncharacterized protein BDZ99DRAFT_574611 [Mytilinidion resinicola]|uniref:CorA-like transporter domain-containing protein n=1 Tax=Mytilinidion resinicola TaxID=574789 RepID=A0A6A6YCJ6_9PEZI|nr:uncharacterized protein BDZ99DRAFT_574611 [Mytilinidion resinicola]KAF2805744.1 hypothetical protein BDZ99DRAFT_574611 [Mytilinidion resinicola]
MKLSVDMFRLLCHSFQLHPAFIEIAVSFGFKIEDQDEYFTSCFHKCSKDRGPSHEIFYNIRYVERHGRSKPVDPWSFRQYAVYHQYNGQIDASVWILIQPRSAFRQWLAASEAWRGAGGAIASLYLHLRFLKSSSSSWRWFMNHLSDELEQTRIKVVCQNVPRLSHGSDEVEFSQAQSLELIQAKARRACSAIASTIAVVAILGHQLDEAIRLECDQGPGPEDPSSDLKAEIKQLMLQLEAHARKARELIETVKNVNMLIQRTLDLCNYSTVHSNNTALRQISASAAAENRAMLQLSDANRKDARIMKVASIIALAYLPASLVASIFSTELVHLDPLMLDIGKGIGIFVALVLSLTAGTIATAFLWIRKDAMSAQNKISTSP